MSPSTHRFGGAGWLAGLGVQLQQRYLLIANSWVLVVPVGLIYLYGLVRVQL